MAISLANNRVINYLVVASSLLVTAVLLVSMLVSFVWLPFVVLILPLIAYGYWQTFKKPYLWVIIMVIGTFLGNLVHIIEDAAVPITLFQVALAASVISIVIRRLADGDLTIRLLGLEIHFMLLLALIYVSLLWSPDPMDGFIEGTRFLISVFFIYLVFNEMKRQNEMIYLMVASTVVAVLLGAYALFENITNVDVAIQNILSEGRKLRGRVTGTSHDPNRFATMFFIPMAFTACVILADTKKIYKLLAIASFAIMSGGLVVTYSRSAWVASILMIVIIAWHYRNVKLFAYIGLLIFVVLIAVPQFSYTLINAAQRFLDITAGAADDSSRIRLLLGLAAFGMFIDSYFIGVGYRGFVDRFTDYYSLQETVNVAEPHNVLYTILAELGLIGIILYLLIIVKILMIAHSNIQKAEDIKEKILSITCFSSIIAFLIFYQFYGGGMNDNNLWLMCALAFSLYYAGPTMEKPDDKNEPPTIPKADKP
jgi:O-antigen ligase